MNDDCRRTAERLTAYVDRALDPAERTEVERHLADCPPCLQVARTEEGGRTVVRARAAELRGVEPPPGLRARCEALARAHRAGEPRAETPAWFRLPALGRLVPALAISVFIVAAALVTLALATRQSDAVLATQLVADHAACFRLFGGPGETAADAVSVERMLAGEYGWDVGVPPSSLALGMQLIGARRCLYGDGTMPHLMYRVHGQDVSLYMLDGVTRPAAHLMSLGHESRIWSRGARTFVLVSPAEARGVAAAASYVMQRAH